MTISKEQALHLFRQSIYPYALSGTQADALYSYIESVDSDTSIRAELRRAAMTGEPMSTIAWDIVCDFAWGYSKIYSLLNQEDRRTFYLMVAEAL